MFKAAPLKTELKPIHSGPSSPDNIRSCTALTVSTEIMEEGELAEGSKVREDLQKEMVHN